MHADRQSELSVVMSSGFELRSRDWQSMVSMVTPSAAIYVTQAENALKLCPKLPGFKEKP